MKELAFNVAMMSPEALAAVLTDCPECEYCCAIGLCCPPLQMLLTLMAIMVRDTHCPPREAHKYALPIVAARIKAMKA